MTRKDFSFKNGDADEFESFEWVGWGMGEAVLPTLFWARNWNSVFQILNLLNKFLPDTKHFSKLKTPQKYKKTPPKLLKTPGLKLKNLEKIGHKN